MTPGSVWMVNVASELGVIGEVRLSRAMEIGGVVGEGGMVGGGAGVWVAGRVAGLAVCVAAG